MQRIDFYTEPHSEQRHMLFENAHKANTINYEDPTLVQSLIKNMRVMIKTIREHAENEDTWLHPFIAHKYEKDMLLFEHDHKAQEDLLDALESSVDALEKSLGQPFDLGQKLYQSLYRFMARYLHHIEQEEALMPRLLQDFTDAELAVVVAAFLTTRHPIEAEAFLKRFKENSSTTELETFFTIIQDIYPAFEYEKIMTVYAKV
ncbi:MAG: hypothetical protein ACTHJ4_07775 [Candidatus Nucleicultricaceae bacterium]